MTLIKYIKNISDHFLELEKRVNKIRFARIEAAKRIKKKGARYNTVISFYSILITALAIVFSIVSLTDIKPDNNITLLNIYQKETVIILALSSFITMLTLFLSNRNYSERSAKFQSNYMELTRLLADIQNLIVYYKLQNYEEYERFKIIWRKKNANKDLDKRLAKKYKIFADKYAALLTQSENHASVDYKRARLDVLEDEIVMLEKINFKEDTFESELIDCIHDNNGNFKVSYSKNKLNFTSPQKTYCEPTAELKNLYRKYADLEQEIIESEFLDTVKYIIICILPIILLVIFDFFEKIIETFH